VIESTSVAGLSCEAGALTAVSLNVAGPATGVAVGGATSRTNLRAKMSWMPDDVGLEVKAVTKSPFGWKATFGDV
jgi:hypothetical protein